MPETKTMTGGHAEEAERLVRGEDSLPWLNGENLFPLTTEGIADAIAHYPNGGQITDALATLNPVAQRTHQPLPDRDHAQAHMLAQDACDWARLALMSIGEPERCEQYARAAQAAALASLALQKAYAQ